ncbi:MAG: hypothetical protein RLZZ156_1780 [Deinococcota bacterium]|jgi:hypothetical protein
MEETAQNSKILETSGESALSVRPQLEQVATAEGDSRGVGYVMNWVSLILLFVISMIAIAWFGPFSEV